MTIFEGWSLTFNLPAKNVAGDSVFVKPIIKGAIDLYSYDGKMVIGSHEKDGSLYPKNFGCGRSIEGPPLLLYYLRTFINVPLSTLSFSSIPLSVASSFIRFSGTR